jgi:hypothetical protein
MSSVKETIQHIVTASTWDERVTRIRQIPARHGTNEHARIHAEITCQLYVPHLAPDYAYVHVADFYELLHFQDAYAKAVKGTVGFTQVSVAQLTSVIHAEPTVLLPLRVITGLTRNEFAGSTRIVGEPLGLKPLASGKVDSMERRGIATTLAQAEVAAETVDQIMRGTLFGEPPVGLKSKQQKPDTANGWATVQQYAAQGVPYGVFLHQRH